MKLSRRGFVELLAGGAALAAGIGAAGVAAADEWCDTDPMVRLTTPAGKNLVVRVTDYALGVQHLTALGLATYSVSVAPANSGTATAVTLTINIPGDQYAANYPTRSVVSSAADDSSHVYQVFSDLSGTAGSPIVHQFILSTP